jgi:hypothetical protein
MSQYSNLTFLELTCFRQFFFEKGVNEAMNFSAKVSIRANANQKQIPEEENN